MVRRYPQAAREGVTSPARSLLLWTRSGTLARASGTPHSGLLFGLGVSVMSGTQEMVLTGGELTLFQAVGRLA